MPVQDTTVADSIIFGRVDPHIYAFTTETIPNYLKVGDTYRPVSKRIQEWRNHYPNLLFRESDKWVAKVSDGRIFRDYSVHHFLKTKGKSPLVQGLFPLAYYSNEFFKDTSPEDIKEAIEDIRECANNNNGKYQLYSPDYVPEIPHYERTETYNLRPNQDETVKNFVQAIGNGRTNLLMYAVMRFGKSFTAMCCAQAMKDCKLVLIVSAKADVCSEWQKTVESHVRFSDCVFLTKSILSGDESAIATVFANNKRAVIFLTLQDLLGNEIKDSHKEIFKNRIDLLIVDETHYGARASQLGRILKAVGISEAEKNNELIDADSEEDSEKNDKIVKSLNAKVKLHLSGTPYRILMGNEFAEEDIIAFCQFTDIIELQKQWEESRLSRDEKDNEGNEQQEWDNPYFGFPEMIRFAFRPNAMAIAKMEQLKEQGYTYAFSALLKPKSITKSRDGSHRKFDNEAEILDLLSVIDGSKSDDNLLGFLDYPKIKDGNMCRHMVFVLPYRASCDAMEELIKTHCHEFKNLNKYEIINISGVDRGNLLSNDEIKTNIRRFEAEGKKTITLTVNRMLTGSTVEQWDTMLYFKDTASPQEYDQAVFRLQNQYIQSFKDNDGKTVKLNLKPQTLLVDLDPNRMFRMQELKSQFYNANTDKRGNSRLEDRIAKELEISPIITINHNKLAQVSPANIMDAVRNYSQTKSIADESQDIPFDMSLLNIEAFKNEIESLKAIDNTKGIEIKPITDEEVDDLDIPVIDESSQESGSPETNGTGATSSSSANNNNHEESIEKKIATYYSKILFFSFLTDNRVKSLQDIIHQIQSNDDDHRIAKNIGLKVGILSLIQSRCNAFILSKLDYKIQSINELMCDSNLEPVKRAEIAMTKFARLSNSEVVTPSLLADELVGMIPTEKVKESIKFLDIASVQGEIAIAIYKRFGDCVKDNIYSIPTSTLTYELTRKVYRLLGLEEDHIFDFYAYDLIKENSEPLISKLVELNPDVVCGVPPFSERTGGGRGDGGSAIYHKFFNVAKNSLSSRFIAMMMQSTWYTGGRGDGLDDFRNYMLSINTEEKHVKEFHDYPNIEAYIKGVTTLRGGICLFLWDREYNGNCTFINRINHRDYEMVRPLRYETGNYHAGFLIRWNRGLSILEKVLNNEEHFLTDNELMHKRNPFGFPNVSSDNWLIGTLESEDRWVKVYLSKGKVGYAKINEFTKEKGPGGLLNKWKVLIAKSSPGGDEIPHLVISNPIVAGPGTATANTHYVIEGVSNETEARNLANYMKTKFFRFMVNLLRSNQNMRVEMYQFVPRLDFSRNWTDDMLFNRYHLDEEDQRFINTIIRERQ